MNVRSNILRKTIFCGLLSLVLAAGACTEKNNKSITIATFDGDSYGDWEMKGNAFPSSPSGEEGTHQMIGFQGEGFASSLNYQNESAAGSLTSPSFTIEKKSIHFMLGAHHIHFFNDENPDDLAVQLLINNEVVRSKVPANPEFHAMFWQSWDVEEFMGQSAQFRILDQDSSGWAHIDVDQIVQTDLPVNGQLIERRMKVSASKINFPVKEGAERYYVRIFNGGEQIRGMDVELATNPATAEYWVVTDLSKWQGQEITLRTRQYGSDDPSILDDVTFANDIVDSDSLYQEPLRPQFHFPQSPGGSMTQTGWYTTMGSTTFFISTIHMDGITAEMTSIRPGGMRSAPIWFIGTSSREPSIPTAWDRSIRVPQPWITTIPLGSKQEITHQLSVCIPRPGIECPGGRLTNSRSH